MIIYNIMISNIMRHLKYFFIFFFVTFPVFSYAAGDSSYVPLAPLPGVGSGGASSFGGYLGSLFNIGIGIAVVLAVIMLTVAGIEYMGGGANESLKTDAKERIWSSILGLLLAIGAWLILNIINPQLLGLNLGSGGGTSGGSTPTVSWCYKTLLGNDECYTNEKSCKNEAWSFQACTSK